MRTLVLVTILLTLCSGIAGAGTWNAPPSNALWYNGDPNTSQTLEYWFTSNTCRNDSHWLYVYDDFKVPAGQTWTINEIWGYFAVDTRYCSLSADKANWQIWNSGITNDPSWSGTETWTSSDLLATNTRKTSSTAEVATTVLDTGNTVTMTPFTGGTTTAEIYEVLVSGLNVVLSGGASGTSFWVGIAPDDGATSGGAQDYNCYPVRTSGANAIGSPAGNDGNSYGTASWCDGVNGAGGSASNPPSQWWAGNLSVREGTNVDFSYGIAGTETGGIIPEPISMIFFGTGLAAVSGFVTRRRMPKK